MDSKRSYQLLAKAIEPLKPMKSLATTLSMSARLTAISAGSLASQALSFLVRLHGHEIHHHAGGNGPDVGIEAKAAAPFTPLASPAIPLAAIPLAALPSPQVGAASQPVTPAPLALPATIAFPDTSSLSHLEEMAYGFGWVGTSTDEGYPADAESSCCAAASDSLTRLAATLGVAPDLIGAVGLGLHQDVDGTGILPVTHQEDSFFHVDSYPSEITSREPGYHALLAIPRRWFEAAWAYSDTKVREPLSSAKRELIGAMTQSSREQYLARKDVEIKESLERVFTLEGALLSFFDPKSGHDYGAGASKDESTEAEIAAQLKKAKKTAIKLEAQAFNAAISEAQSFASRYLDDAVTQQRQKALARGGHSADTGALAGGRAGAPLTMDMDLATSAFMSFIRNVGWATAELSEEEWTAGLASLGLPAAAVDQDEERRIGEALLVFLSALAQSLAEEASTSQSLVQGASPSEEKTPIENKPLATADHDIPPATTEGLATGATEEAAAAPKTDEPHLDETSEVPANNADQADLAGYSSHTHADHQAGHLAASIDEGHARPHATPIMTAYANIYDLDDDLDDDMLTEVPELLSPEWSSAPSPSPAAAQPQAVQLPNTQSLALPPLPAKYTAPLDAGHTGHTALPSQRHHLPTKMIVAAFVANFLAALVWGGVVYLKAGAGSPDGVEGARVQRIQVDQEKFKKDVQKKLNKLSSQWHHVREETRDISDRVGDIKGSIADVSDAAKEIKRIIKDNDQQIRRIKSAGVDIPASGPKASEPRQEGGEELKKKPLGQVVPLDRTAEPLADQAVSGEETLAGAGVIDIAMAGSKDPAEDDLEDGGSIIGETTDIPATTETTETPAINALRAIGMAMVEEEPISEPVSLSSAEGAPVSELMAEASRIATLASGEAGFTAPLSADVGRLSGQVSRLTSEFRGLFSHLSSQMAIFAALPTMPPLQGKVTSPYGRRLSPLLAARSAEFHRGIDIAAPKGSVVFAPADGLVVFSAPKHGFGNCLILSHGLVETAFGHLSKMLVRQGQRVRRGQPIARVGSTGRSTGPHLHFEVRIDGRPVDPGIFIGKEAQGSGALFAKSNQ